MLPFWTWSTVTRIPGHILPLWRDVFRMCWVFSVGSLFLWGRGDFTKFKTYWWNLLARFLRHCLRLHTSQMLLLHHNIRLEEVGLHNSDVSYHIPQCVINLGHLLILLQIHTFIAIQESISWGLHPSGSCNLRLQLTWQLLPSGTL